MSDHIMRKTVAIFGIVSTDLSHPTLQLVRLHLVLERALPRQQHHLPADAKVYWLAFCIHIKYCTHQVHLCDYMSTIQRSAKWEFGMHLVYEHVITIIRISCCKEICAEGSKVVCAK